ncbi:hypothetical protein F5148DRAFT_1178971 [Russula earlei]|uniref:Uncharacterized protein n=1 Tax=Russula earlei TaxID=71964 RepID=A0ACC0UHI6_9AGAM|nr:hypothetical protein F5148DRAFT_1178971 [Russula earlei]
MTATTPPARIPALSRNRNRQAVAPFSAAPVNGLSLYTKREDITGSWTIDPLAPLFPEQNLVQMFLDGQSKKKCRRARSSKTAPLSATFSSRHGSIQAALRVLGDSLDRSIATIRAESRKGNVVLNLVSITPMRTVHIDAYSRKGSVTLLVPRTFSGLVQLSSRHGAVEVLPSLAASGRVIRTKNKEITVLLGEGPMPVVGSDSITDTARIYSRHGPVRLGFSGEDRLPERPKLMEHCMQFVHRLMAPSSTKSLPQYQ